MTESTITTHSTRELQAIFGIQDQWLRKVCSVLPVRIFACDATIHICGQAEDVRQATRILEYFRRQTLHHQTLTPEEVARVIESVCGDFSSPLDENASVSDDTLTGEAASGTASTLGVSSTPAALLTPHIFPNSVATQERSTTATNSSVSMEVPTPRSSSANREQRDRLPPMRSPMIDVFTRRPIRPKTRGQASYLDAVSKHDVTFCVGPAGTGKTYLAVAMAVTYLKEERIRKIALVRPAVEAGENLGFLPGDLQAKINPYLRPLLDAIREMIDYDTLQRLTEQEVIEMVPLAYMRGRTLNEAFMILDEAQNTTVAQMKMFLTRMGAGSKVVVCGDVTQNDLPRNTVGGLPDALRRLRGIRGIALHTLDASDIVRHSLVQEIVRAYDAPESDEMRSRLDVDSDHSANRNIL